MIHLITSEVPTELSSLDNASFFNFEEFSDLTLFSKLLSFIFNPDNSGGIEAEQLLFSCLSHL